MKERMSHFETVAFHWPMTKMYVCVLVCTGDSTWRYHGVKNVAVDTRQSQTHDFQVKTVPSVHAYLSAYLHNGEWSNKVCEITDARQPRTTIEYADDTYKTFSSLIK